MLNIREEYKIAMLSKNEDRKIFEKISFYLMVPLYYVCKTSDWRYFI